MHFLKIYNEKILKNDLINKFKTTSIKKIPQLNKITLNFGCKNFNIQKFAITLLALEIISTKKSSITVSKSANIFLKIQKGQPSGCKVIIKKNKINIFVEKLILNIIPNLKNFSGFKIQTTNSNFSFKISNDTIIIKEFKECYPLFTILPTLDIQMSTNTNNLKELLFIAKSMKIPIIKTKEITG